MEMMSVYCHSGGCKGADLYWEYKSKPYGITTISYSFPSHINYGETPYIMNLDELYEGWEKCVLASKSLKRPINKIQYNPYIRNLISRNWFQVKNSEKICAIGFLEGNNKVSGGTGWAVQMAIDCGKDIIVFNQDDNFWYTFDYISKTFIKSTIEDLKIPTHFAGIGTRDLKENGKEAIKTILKLNFYE